MPRYQQLHASDVIFQRSSGAEKPRIDDVGIVRLACRWGLGRRQGFLAADRVSCLFL